MTAAELNEDIYEQVLTLSEEADDLVDGGDLDAALNKYADALDLLPEPLHEWEASTWLFASIGDVLWTQRNLPLAYDAFNDALGCPGGIGNPFIHLRVGQLDFELGNIDKARDELMRAFMGGDRKIFEQEDPRYFALIEELI